MEAKARIGVFKKDRMQDGNVSVIGVYFFSISVVSLEAVLIDNLIDGISRRVNKMYYSFKFKEMIRKYNIVS